MGFEALKDKVKQAETALEARERQTAADWRQLKASWRAAWTPGRIIVAGLASGFLVGKLEPAKRLASGNNALQMLSTLAGLFAGGSAQAAAGEAAQAAGSAQQVAATTASASASATAATAATPAAAAAPSVSASTSTPEALRRTGQL
jgi:hypothetical protein